MYKYMPILLLCLQYIVQIELIVIVLLISTVTYLYCRLGDMCQCDANGVGGTGLMCP